MNVFELFGTIAINNKDANAALKDTSEKAERTGARLQQAFKNVGSATVKVGKAVGTAAMTIGTAWVATIESTRDYRTEMAKLDTAFTTNGHSAETAKKTYQALQAVLGETDQSVEAANHLAVMCSNEEDLAKWTDICTGVFATFGDSLPIEGLTESANETSKVGTVTGSLADALNWAGVSEEDFNLKLRACRTEQERQKLILNTLFPMYKQSAESYKENAENVMKANTAQDKLNSAMAKLGEIGEPILTGVKGWIADMVNSAAPHLQTLIGKLSNFDETMRKDVWPWIRKEAKAKLGLELPPWADVKLKVQTWWMDTKANLDTVTQWTLQVLGLSSWDELGPKVQTWWTDTKNNIATVTKWALQMPEKPHETAEEIGAAVSEWWTTTALPAVKGASAWALNLFDHPVEDNATIETHVKEWWNVAAEAVAGACNWTLRLFGMPEETADKITSIATTWWSSYKDFVIDACSFTARFMGFGEWTEEQDKLLDSWWNTAVTKLDEVCQWVLHPKLPDEEETQAFVDGLTTWWQGVQETARNVVGLTPEKEDKYIAYEEDLQAAGQGNAFAQEIINASTRNSDSFIDWGAMFNAILGKNPASVPVEVSEDSESNMQSQVDSMNLEGEVTLYPNTSKLNMVYGGSFIGGGGGKWVPQSRAVGLDEVPYDGYYAHLHKGEAILNRVQADAWRGGNTGKIESLLAQLVANTRGGQQVVLDSGVMVGQLAPMMDARLGTISGRKGRGN